MLAKYERGGEIFALSVKMYDREGEIGMFGRLRKMLLAGGLTAALILALTGTVFAAPDAGQVSTAIESTWKTAATQIKTVTNNVIFPVVDCVLAILLFVKLAMCYFDYKKHGEFEFTPVAILFFGLVFAITAPAYIWNILGI